MEISEEIYERAEEYFPRLLHDLDSAKKTIDFESYIFSEDMVGEQIARALIDAHLRGVQVRLILDGFGSRHWGGHLAHWMEESGLNVKIYHPLPWHFGHWKWATDHSEDLSKFFHLLRAINRRNHRKSCLIDQKTAWIGSYNVSVSHLPRSKGGKGWRDTAIRMTGRDFSRLQFSFDTNWKNQVLKPRPKFLLGPIRLNDFRSHRRKLAKDLRERLLKARNRVWITNAYFVPDNRFLKALEETALRGVDVRLLLPRNSDVFFIPWATRVFYDRLLASKVRVFEYKKGFLHAKTILIDHWGTVGSSNLNQRSFLHDLEVDAEVSLPSAITQLEHHFLDDLQESEEISHGAPQRWYVKILGKAILYLKYWM